MKGLFVYLFVAVTVLAQATSEEVSVSLPTHEPLRAVLEQGMWRLQESLRRYEGYKQAFKALLEDNAGATETRDDTSLVEVLEDIALRSTRDMRVLDEALRRQSLEAQHQVQRGLETVEEQYAALQQRGRRATAQLRSARQLMKAAEVASLRQMEALAAETEAELAEVVRLEEVRKAMDAATQAVLAQKSTLGGPVGEWRRRLSSFISGWKRPVAAPSTATSPTPGNTSPRDSVSLEDPDDGPVADPVTEDTGQEEAVEPAPGHEESPDSGRDRHNKPEMWLRCLLLALSWAFAGFRLYAWRQRRQLRRQLRR